LLLKTLKSVNFCGSYNKADCLTFPLEEELAINLEYDKKQLLLTFATMTFTWFGQSDFDLPTTLCLKKRPTLGLL